MKNNLTIPIAGKDKEGFELFDKEDVYFFIIKMSMRIFRSKANLLKMRMIGCKE